MNTGIDKDNNLIQRFNYAQQRMPTSMTMNNEIYYLHYDQVGTLRAVTDENQNIIKEITYDTFGNILQDTNREFKVPFGFAGGLHDRDTNLVHFGYREYDPLTGKWTAKDPIDFSGGDSNLYGYVLGDPVNLVDPTGLNYSFGVDPNAAGGNGHTTLYFQNSLGNWYAYNQGAAGGTSLGGQYGFLGGSNAAAGATIEPIQAPPADAFEFESSREQDECITKNALQSQQSHNSGQSQYNLYSNNCTDAAVGIVNSCSGINVPNPWYTVRPNSWFQGLQ